MLKMYIAILDECPDFMVPTLVAHSVLANHCQMSTWVGINPNMEKCKLYLEWLNHSFKKVTLRVNRKEFDKIRLLQNIHLGHENTICDGNPSCIVVNPRLEYPNVIKFAKTWKPL